jgi:hypothetical protein
VNHGVFVDAGSREESASEQRGSRPVQSNACRCVAAGHDTATLKAFSGRAGREAGLIGGISGLSCQSIRHPVSLRINAKRGIVACLDAAGWVRIRDDP